MPSTNFAVELPEGRLWPLPLGHRRPPVVPSYMRGKNMQLLLGACGTQMDAMSDQILFARLQAIPSAGPPGGPFARLADGRLIQCEPFVLPVLAQQRGIPIYPTEGEQSQRERIARAWQLRARKGQHLGVFQHVRPYFNDFVYAPDGSPTGNSYPAMDVAFRTGDGVTCWHRMAADGAYSIYRPASDNFNYDGRTSLRCRAFYFVRMTGTGFTAPFTYDSGPDYDDGHVYDANGTAPFSAARMADIAQMIIDWSAATTWVNVVAFVWDSSAVDPTTSPTRAADGRWSLPNGAGTWAGLVDPVTNLATRPLGVVFFYVRNVP